MNPNEKVPVVATAEEIEAGLFDQRIDDLITITEDRIKTNAHLCDVATTKLIELIGKGALDDREGTLKEFATSHVPHINVTRLEEPSRNRLKIINEMKAEEEKKQEELEKMTLAEFLEQQAKNDQTSD